MKTTSNSKRFKCNCSSRTKPMLKKKWGNNNNNSSLRFITRETTLKSSILLRGQMLGDNQETKKDLKRKEFHHLVDRKRTIKLVDLMMSSTSNLRVLLIRDLPNFRLPTSPKMRMSTWFITLWLPKETWARQTSISTVKMKKKIGRIIAKTSFRILRTHHLILRDQLLSRMPTRYRFWRNSSYSYNNSSSRNITNREVADRVLDKISKICPITVSFSKSRVLHKCKTDKQ